MAAENRLLLPLSVMTITLAEIESRGLTFEELRADPFWSRLIEHMEAKLGSPLQDETKMYLVDSIGNIDVRVNQVQSWIESTASLTKAIVTEAAHAAEYPLFWIKLYSLVYDYYPRIDRGRDLYLKSFMKDYVLTFDTFVASFTEDDLGVLTYFRNHHVHINVDSVRLQSKFDGQNVKFRVPKNWESEKLAKERLGIHDWNQATVARELAERISDSLIGFLLEARKVVEEDSK
jgi:hypothetical protein